MRSAWNELPDHLDRLAGYHLSQRLLRFCIQKIRHFERDIIGVTDKQELQRLFLPAVEKDPSVKTLYLNSFSPVSFAALINFYCWTHLHRR